MMDEDEYFDPRDYEEDDPTLDPSKHGSLPEEMDQETIDGLKGLQVGRPADVEANKTVLGTQLVGYADYSRSLRLYGASYEPVRKGTYYSIIGAIVADTPLYFNSLRIDPRFNEFVCVWSGCGKGVFKDLIKRTMAGLGLAYVCPTSLHPEQLVGKIVTQKVRGNGYEEVPVIGHLGERFVVFDEALYLLADKNHEESRNYIKTALDPLGRNEIVKRQVGHSRALRYFPNCTMVFFFQPVDLPLSLLITGLMRRGMTLWPHIPEDERLSSIESVVNNKDTTEELDAVWNGYIEHLRQIKERQFNWRFAEGYSEKLLEYTRLLFQRGLGDTKSREIAGTFLHDLMHNLIRLSALIAADNLRDEITLQDLETAYKDLALFWDMTLEFIKDKLKIGSHYLIRDKYYRCLEMLAERNCLSEETTTLSIGEYDALIAREFSCSEISAAQTYRYKLARHGYIESKQVGKTATKVWITKKGQEMLSKLVSPPSL